jgi:hypothetical protein
MTDQGAQHAPTALDYIGIRHGTDKSSLIGDYLRHYERIFSSYRQDAFNLIEIGVFRGASARTWVEYFTKAQIIGVDIDPRCREFATDRLAIEIGNQNDPSFLHKLVTKYPPRIIIDDGSHQSYDIIFTFERLFPTLQFGGIYVIEDLHFHFMNHEAERLRGGSPILAHDYVAGLSRDRLGSAAYIMQLDGLRRYLLTQIDRIEIIGQAAVIHKVGENTQLTDLYATHPYIESSRDWRNWFNYSQKLLDLGAGDQAVVSALRRAIDCDRTLIITYHRLSEAFERLLDFDSALATLESAISVARDDVTLSELNQRIQRINERKLRDNASEHY